MSKSQPIIGDYKISEDDVLLVGYAELDEKTLVYHQLSSANDFYSVGLRQIITQVFKVEREFINLRDSTPEDTEIEKIHMLIKFTDVFVNKPTTFTFPSGKEELLFPNEALRKDKTYSASLKVNAVIKVTATLTNGTTKVRDDVIKDWMLCKIPIMKGSKLCNTYGMSKESLMQLKEDPLDIGGYYIASGIERTVDSVENILFNQIRIFKNNYGKELLRIGFVSKPGDTYQNSDYFIGRFLRDGQITCEILRDKLKELQIPFYLIYRALGWTTDKEMIDNIVYGYDDAISKNMLNFIIEAMGVKYNKLSHYRYEYNQHNILRAIVNEFKDREFEYLKLNENPENYQIAIKNILYILDTNFLPHVGTTKNDRHKKLRYLSLMIRKLLLTHMNILKPSDRDTFKSKRVHTAGTNYAKAFKTYFNAAIVQQIKRRLVRDFRAIPFSKIDLAASVKNSVLPHEFEKSIIQALTTGSKSQITINKKPRTNHMSSQLLSRKNQLAALTTLRQIIVTTSDSSKQSERAHDMRRVHMSALGYVCNVHSPEGEKVGVNKQIAIFASIVGSTSSEILKDTLVNDKSVNPLDTITHKDIYDNDLSNVFVNGDWIGCTRDSFKLADKYRKMRRDLKIHPMTTIYWDNTQDELYFWVDVGRMIRPLLIVYNNKRDPEMFPAKLQKENSPFTQGLALTSSHVKKLQSKEIDIEYLLKNKIIEYITAEEQENCYLCYAFDKLRSDKNNELREYTHCDIPQSQLGITALTSPFAHHNQPTRLTFQCNQGKSTCGKTALNWAFRCDKDTFLQYNCEMPLVQTMSSRYLHPNGSNVIVAIMCYSGYNQEDSLLINEGSVKKGLFNGSKFTFKKTSLDQKEEFGNPDINNTDDLSSASYDKLTDGLIAVGSIVNKGDALIGKSVRLNKTSSSDYNYSDKSIIYKNTEPAIVHDVIKDRNEDDEKFVKVLLRKPRSVSVGDKFSSRAGQKGVVGILLKEAEMPFTEDGMRPSIIMNPHSIPSRMTIGQLNESLAGNWCAAKGVHADATIFRKVDMDAISDELESMGMHRNGYRRLYNGTNGTAIDTLIFTGPTYYQRLHKFVIDQVYSVSHGPSDAKTLQPLDGKSSGGGLKIGEMEKDVLCSHGVSRFLSEKFFDHSDGYREYICRCGKAAVFNKRENIYKCVYCKDNADISKINTSWTAKLFKQELESMNIGVRTYPEPFTYETML